MSQVALGNGGLGLRGIAGLFFFDLGEVPLPQLQVLDHSSSLQSMHMGVRRPGFKS